MTGGEYPKRVFAACFLYNFIYKRNVTAYLSMQFKVDGDIISLILSNKTDY